MRLLLLILGCALLATPGRADDRRIISAQMQELADAVAPGNKVVWNNYLDAKVIYAEENDTYKGIKEIEPLPRGLSGSIVVVLLSINSSINIQAHTVSGIPRPRSSFRFRKSV